MKRLLAGLLICGLMGLAGCGQKSEKKGGRVAVITLNYANFPPAATFPCVQMEQWKKEVEQRTGGRVKINTYPGGTLLGAKDIFDGVIAGAADIGNFAMSYQPGRFPVSEAVDLPHFFKDAKTSSRILSELIAEFQPAEFSNVKVLTLFTCPPSLIMSAKEIKTLDDVKGQSLRSSGTSADMVKRLGAVPVAMPQSDVPDALQKGMIKGIVSSGEVLKDMNYAAYCPYVYKADLCVISFAVVMNKAKYEALPEDVRQVFDELYASHASWTGAYVDQHVQDALVWSEATHGVKVREPSGGERENLRAVAKSLLEEYVARVSAKGVDGGAVVDFITKKMAE